MDKNGKKEIRISGSPEQSRPEAGLGAGEPADELEIMARELADRIDQAVPLSGTEKEELLSHLLMGSRQIYTDSVTDICNRRYYDDRLCDLEGEFACAMIDMDNFKCINDYFGHQAGDAALYLTAQAIRSEIRADDELVRYGGDEFFLIFRNMPQDHFEQKLLEIHREIDGIRIPEYPRLRISASIGGAYGSGRIAQLLHKADLAMYQAKATQSRVMLYDGSDGEAEAAEEHPAVRLPGTEEPGSEAAWYHDRGTFHEKTQEIVDALRNGEFEPWFQPQYNHATGNVVGAEALARWKKGNVWVPPAEFIPMLEQSGSVYQLDRYIWEQVCILLRRWLDEGREPLPVSVNVSRRDIMHDDFIEALTGLVEKYRIPLPLFPLEITESAFADSTQQVIRKINELIELGFTVEIDDFGSGYSTLNSLKDVPARVLKLDMHFFEYTGNSDRAGIIVESVVRMAKWLGMNIIAEGVENKEQADFLKSLGCYYIQGYYYARPMPRSDYEALLDRRGKEPELHRLKRVAELENSRFWDPASMETLIFNSYVGGACIFELHDGETELLRINDRYVQQFGGVMEPDGDAKRLGIMQYLDENDREELMDAIKRAMDSGEEASCEVRATRGKHTEFLRISVRIIARTKDRALGYSMVMNMTEQREAERKERNASRQLRSIMDSVNGGVTATVFRSPTDIEMIFTNDGFFKLHGYTREQYDAEVGFINDLIYPEDREWTGALVENIVRDHATRTYELRAVKRDGSVIWVRMTNSVIALEGVGENVLLGIETDVTEEHLARQRRKEANEQLRFLNEAAHELLAQSDSEGPIRQTLQRFMGYFRGDRAYVVELDDDRQIMNNTYEVCADGVRSEIANLQNVPFRLLPVWFETLKKNEQVVIDSVEALGDDQRELRALLLAQDIHSIFVTPLLYEGKLIGYAGVDNPRQSVDHRVRLSALGDYITALLVRRNLSAGLGSERKMFFEMMNDITDGFVRLKVGVDGRFVLDFINDSMCRFLRSDRETLRSIYADDTLSCIHPDDRRLAVENIRRCIEADGLTGKRVRYRLLRGDGTYVSITLSGHESRDEQGRRSLNLFYYLDTAEDA